MCLGGEILLCLNYLLADMTDLLTLYPIETCEVSHMEAIDWGMFSVYCF